MTTGRRSVEIQVEAQFRSRVEMWQEAFLDDTTGSHKKP